ncbi:alpha-L-rhamnosidase C-terminal domain-containing protein [Cerasicoccus arenae]|uniref:alpha-L-rhamnosidase n=1 Tax=Cerasicoccus arenae TaxID=424488 RepID=A0A8J3GEN2_9BACT|nr:alpha-L-rhamnosidase C-terminal domain-containing protein [Cerasicoccus arenae]MBK1858468.1 hypothetical protein [Cerasicoccus arenae]GHC10469.1 hypothetical protein GCM10007047_29780 [Cerasicoccus arenae]
MPDPVFTIKPKTLVETLVAPSSAHQYDDGAWFLDFGRSAFGTLIVPGNGRVTVHLGETLTSEGRVDRAPPGKIRYRRIEQDLATAGSRLIIPPDERNTGPAAILMPPEIGEVLPFRYAEIEGVPDLDIQAVRQVFVHYPFDDNAAHFESSDDALNAVWELCKYTIKATTFCGVYVDGDRERIAYEGDAYVNQLGHYCVDQEYALARYTHEYLLRFSTWPTDWQLVSVMMAWEDYCYTGDAQSLEAFYDVLKAKTLIGLAREDGLISSDDPRCDAAFERTLNLWHERYIFGHGLRDLVDWPPGSFTTGGTGERDNHEMLPINTVVNAYHAYAVGLMGNIARALGKTEDAVHFEEQRQRVLATLNQLLWDNDRGVYVDGEGSTHASLHSNAFMLAFDLVPPERLASVVMFVKSRGMACSVYGAQFLLEGLYKAGEADAALSLMTTTDERGWMNMIASGSTMTWEAWDWKYKNNLDWNHAWGAAPANIIPRCLMGVQPLEPGCHRMGIRPQPGSLERAAMRHPTPLGSLCVSFEQRSGEPFRLLVEVPQGMTALVTLPTGEEFTAKGAGSHQFQSAV